MATYVIGDVQGCFDSLTQLLDRIPAGTDDEIILAGDLVNRGPKSLEVLRLAARDRRFTAVLGNHDLHLFSRLHGIRPQKPRDTLETILEAPDSEELLHWLANRPVLIHRPGWLVVHAGLMPSWDRNTAEVHARRVEAAICDPQTRPELLRAISRRSKDDLARVARVFTFLRMLDASGEPEYEYSGPIEGAPKGLTPWFRAPHPRSERVAFGHWAMAGFRMEDAFVALDSGCVWGQRLTAVRLEDRGLWSVPSQEGAVSAFD